MATRLPGPNHPRWRGLSSIAPAPALGDAAQGLQRAERPSPECNPATQRGSAQRRPPFQSTAGQARRALPGSEPAQRHVCYKEKEVATQVGLASGDPRSRREAALISTARGARSRVGRAGREPALGEGVAPSSQLPYLG
eukprot:12253623-Alexandrium_andersonii.AAC.1